MQDDDEIRAVAQAIADCHAKVPGLDCEGRLDDAKTIIAAFDALVAFRGGKLLAEAAKPRPSAPAHVPAADPAPPPPAAEDTDADMAANVTPLPKKRTPKKG